MINLLNEGKELPGKCGQTLMSAAVDSGLSIEAACDGNCACSTCHVYIDEEFIDKLPEPSCEEEDMLDLALFVKSNSRLACQITLNKEMDGLSFKIPSATRNFYAK